MLIILLLLFLVSIFIFKFKGYEHYKNLNIYPSRLLGMHKFAKLHNNKIISLDIKPIEPTINESKCDIHYCPIWLSDNMTCYKCY